MTASIFERANARFDKPGALEASLRNRNWRNEDMAHGYETGQATTKRASTGPLRALGRFASQFIPRGKRVRPTSPDRAASMRRKRTIGGASEIPDRIRGHYTHGEQAALVVIVNEIAKHSCCDMCIDEIAARAGVGRTTVQNALRKAQHGDLGHMSVEMRPRPGRKNLPNIVRLISREWVEWLKRRIGFKKLRPTKILKQESLISVQGETLPRALERVKADKSAHDQDGRLLSLAQGIVSGMRFGRDNRHAPVGGQFDRHQKPMPEPV